MYLDNAVADLGKDGALVLEPGSLKGADYGIEPWSQGLSAYKNEDGFWRTSSRDRELVLISFRHLADIDLVVHRFISGIPLEICKAVREIRYLQLPLLQLAAKSGYFRDLLISTPFLAWMLMDHATKHSWSDSQIDEVSQRKQTEILNEISGVCEKSFIRLLRSIQLVEGTEKELGLICKAMTPEIRRALQHTPVVPVNILEILIKVRLFQNTKLIHSFIDNIYSQECDRLKGARELEKLWKDTVNLGVKLQITDAEKRLMECREPYDVWELHNRWTAIFNKSDPTINENIVFAEPPIPDTSTIIGIRNYAELIEEGRVMENCVAILCDEVLSGKSYIYRVFEPERATLKIRLFFGKNEGKGLIKGQQGDETTSRYSWTWGIEEFKLKKNKMPPEEAWFSVIKWVNHYYKKLHETEDPGFYRKAKWGE